MAEAYESDAEGQRLLECPVCMDHLQDQRMLPCQHTFCTGCLKPLVVGNKLACPVCRQVYRLKPSGVAGLPRNLLIGTLQDKQCEQCLVRKRNAFCYCCKQHLCGVCLKEHQVAFEKESQCLQKDSAQLLPHVATGIKNIYDNIADINKQSALGLNAIDATANKLIDTIMQRQSQLKEELVQIQSQEVEKLGVDLKTLSDYVAVVHDYQSKASNPIVTENKLTRVQALSPGLLSNVKAIKALLSVRNHSIIQFDAEDQKVRKLAAIYGKLNIKKHSMKTNFMAGGIEYQNKNKPQQIFGSDGFKQGQFFYSSSIAISPKTNNIVVCDTGNRRIQIFQSDGKFLSMFGSSGSGAMQFSFDACQSDGSVTVSNQGNIIVADTENNRLQLITEDGHFITALGHAGSNPGQFNRPKGVTVDQSDQIYVCDSENKRVQILKHLGGVVKTFRTADENGPFAPFDIALTSVGNMVVSNPYGHSVSVYNPEGHHEATLGTGPSIHLKYPFGIAIDGDDNILIADNDTYQVHVLDISGKLIHNIGFGINENKMEPISVAVSDKYGQVLVLDKKHHRVLMF